MGREAALEVVGNQPPKPHGCRWRRDGTLLICAAIAALLVSTQFLFQPFVWRNYTIDEIAPAWLEILRDRLVIALAIGFGLVLAGRTRAEGRGGRALWQIAAIVIAAALGEWVLMWVHSEDPSQDVTSLMGRIARWSMVGAAGATMLYVWRSAADLAVEESEARADAARLRRLAAAGRIEALHRQIEPHFLFNTLATIRSLHVVDLDRGQRLLDRLLQLLSATLGSIPAPIATLGAEIELVRAYLEVCAARMGGGLALICDVPEALLERDFPALMLSTLVENAVKHGIGPQDGGTITIVARDVAGGLEVSLSDDGAGMDGSSGGHGHGIGLANIAERLRLLHGVGASVHLRVNRGRGVSARLWLPDKASAS